jgi:hypothetical protein
MAEENKIPLEIEVKGSEESIESFKDLKAAIKAAKDEQIKAASVYGESSKEFQKATEKVSKLKDKVEDLNDSTKSLKGSGVERASEGFSQLGEGLRNLDFDKVKVGLVAMKSALAAVGIGLIVQAVMYLVENFGELSKGSGLLAKALQFVGNIITSIKDGFLALGDMIQGINPELRKMSAEIDGLKESMNGSLSEQTSRLDRLIAVTKANGESTIGYEKLKQEAIIKTNKLYVDSIISYVKAGGQLNDEQKKQLTASLQNIANAKTQQTVLEITENKKQQEENAKNLEAYKKILAERTKAEQDAWNLTVQIRQQNADAQKADDLRLANERLEAKKLADAEWLRQTQETLEEEKALKIDNAEFDRKLVELTEAQKLDISQKSIQSVQQLTDLFFMFKSQKAKKGSKEEEDLARKQFNLNKGLQLGLAVIDGFKSITSSLAQSPIAVGVVPNPIGIASLAFASITAATNIAKIAAAKFQPTGVGRSGESPSTATPNIPSPPVISTQQNNLNQSTQFDSNGKRIGNNTPQEPFKVIANIGIDEVNKTQQRVDTLEKRSTF